MLYFYKPLTALAVNPGALFTMPAPAFHTAAVKIYLSIAAFSSILLTLAGDGVPYLAAGTKLHRALNTRAAAFAYTLSLIQNLPFQTFQITHAFAPCGIPEGFTRARLRHAHTRAPCIGGHTGFLLIGQRAIGRNLARYTFIALTTKRILSVRAE